MQWYRNDLKRVIILVIYSKHNLRIKGFIISIFYNCWCPLKIFVMNQPNKFVPLITESIMEKELESFRDVLGSSRDKLCARFYYLRHLAQRPAQVAQRLQDDSSDAIYRNGLGVFIQLLVRSQ